MKKAYTLTRKKPERAPSNDKLEKVLNEPQVEAVTSLYGPHLILAGAGSGKTRTIVYRVAHLVEKGIKPESILLLTFTKKAAFEMMRRATKLLDSRCERVRGGTFHSFANGILRRFAAEIGFSPNFTIIDRSDAEDIVGLLRAPHEGSGRRKRFPKKNTILGVLSKSANTGKPLGALLEEEYPHFLWAEKAFQQIEQEYRAFKKSKGLMDYDDLLLHLQSLLESKSEIRAQLSKEFAFVMVDEYQDTNTIQASIAAHLASTHGNLFVVGDDAQSIYSFRGARFENILEFPERHPTCKIIRLEQNYRSTQPILAFTNAILEKASKRYIKRLFSEKESAHLPVLLRPETVEEQAEFVAQRVLDLREEGIGLEEMAVLFRSGWHSNELEVVLNEYGIPFVKYGGLKFVESAHVKDVLAFYRILHNRTDELAWHRVLKLYEGIGPQTTTKFLKALGESDASPAELLVKVAAQTPERTKKGLLRLQGSLLSLREATTDMGVLTTLILTQYEPLFRRHYDDPDKRKDDLESLQRIAARYPTIPAFLDEVALEPPEGSQEGVDASQPEEGKLVLSTVHSAKGLEWQSVFIIGLVDGYFPSTHSLRDDDQLEEERRLLYVGATRAQDNLYLLAPHLTSQSGGFGGGGLMFSQLSRFLSGVDSLKDLTEEWELAPGDVPK